jgi:hypothetical protein
MYGMTELGGVSELVTQMKKNPAEKLEKNEKGKQGFNCLEVFCRKVCNQKKQV